MARIFYASHRVTVSAAGGTICTNSTNPLHPDDTPITSLIQSVGVNASHDYTQIFELGRFDIYENLEGIPTAEITIERYMNPRNVGAFWRLGGNSVPNCGNARFNVNMSVRDQESCTPTTSGIVSSFNMSISNYTLTFTSDGPATESVTFVGDNIGWTSGSSADAYYGIGDSPNVDDDTDKQIVDRGWIRQGWDSNVQSMTYTVNMDREDFTALGSAQSAKILNYPVTITCEIETVANPGTGAVGDNNIWGVAFSPAGGVTNAAAPKYARNVGNLTVEISDGSGNVVNMGKAYYISSTYGGGDAGGGNATITNTLESYNEFSIDSFEIPTN